MWRGHRWPTTTMTPTTTTATTAETTLRQSHVEYVP